MNVQLVVSLALALVAVACASTAPAPVETRTSGAVGSAASASSVASVSSEPQVARPGYYIVKKGDTLYSIALENGHDYREVAAWNGLENPSLIKVGQALRVVPPGAAGVPVVAPEPAVSGNGTQPVTVPRIEVRPLESAPAAASAPARADNGGVLREPRGGRVAYSDKAWESLQGPSMPRPAASAPVAASEPKPAVRVESPAKPVDDKAEWAWPSSGKLLATFNDSSNKGLDFGGSIGDAVYAAASGKVIYAGSDLRGYGNLVIIKHSSQHTTVYAHNKEILVKEQQQVQKGQKIAVMGDSDADRPKLHFEMRAPGGKPIDPVKLLPTR